MLVQVWSIVRGGREEEEGRRVEGGRVKKGGWTEEEEGREEGGEKERRIFDLQSMDNYILYMFPWLQCKFNWLGTRMFTCGWTPIWGEALGLG